MLACRLEALKVKRQEEQVKEKQGLIGKRDEDDEKMKREHAALERRREAVKKIEEEVAALQAELADKRAQLEHITDS